MKSQPLAYNKDNQEDKEPLFDTVETVLGSLHAFADMVPNIEAKKESMYNAAKQGFSTATDLADYLVGKGIAFRDAHESCWLGGTFWEQKPSAICPSYRLMN